MILSLKIISLLICNNLFKIDIYNLEKKKGLPSLLGNKREYLSER